MLLHVNGHALAEVLCAAPELVEGDSEEMQQTWKQLDDHLGSLRADLCRQHPQLLLVPAQDVRVRWRACAQGPAAAMLMMWNGASLACSIPQNAYLIM